MENRNAFEKLTSVLASKLLILKLFPVLRYKISNHLCNFGITKTTRQYETGKLLSISLIMFVAVWWVIRMASSPVNTPEKVKKKLFTRLKFDLAFKKKVDKCLFFITNSEPVHEVKWSWSITFSDDVVLEKRTKMSEFKIRNRFWLELCINWW